jgi:hypothetical protein
MAWRKWRTWWLASHSKRHLGEALLLVDVYDIYDIGILLESPRTLFACLGWTSDNSSVRVSFCRHIFEDWVNKGCSPPRFFMRSLLLKGNQKVDSTYFLCHQHHGRRRVILRDSHPFSYSHCVSSEAGDNSLLTEVLTPQGVHGPLHQLHDNFS